MKARLRFLSFVGMMGHRSPGSQSGKCFSACLKRSLTTRTPRCWLRRGGSPSPSPSLCPPADPPAALPCYLRARCKGQSHFLRSPHRPSPLPLLLPRLRTPPHPDPRLRCGEGEESREELVPSDAEAVPSRLGGGSPPPSPAELPGGQGVHCPDASRRASCPPGQGRHATQLVVLRRGEERRQTALPDKHFQDQPTPPRPALSCMHRLKGLPGAKLLPVCGHSQPLPSVVSPMAN